MIKQLRKRFISFNVLIISLVLLVLALFVFFGSKNSPHLGRWLPLLIICILLVFAASYLISRFALKPIKTAWQKQLDFTADASHELRTPLTVIRTNLEIIMDSPEETVESQMQWLQNIEAEHIRMTRLVEDLLTISRADSGGQALFQTTFMLNETMDDIVQKFLPVCAQKTQTLSFSCDHPLSFYGDEKRITQLLVILLDNAIQYTPSDGSIHLSLASNHKNITIKIEDTGAGIPSDELDKIFDRFYRSGRTRQNHPDGSGLGLSIAKWIVEQHGGTISVASKPNQGTTFTLRF